MVIKRETKYKYFFSLFIVLLAYYVRDQIIMGSMLELDNPSSYSLYIILLTFGLFILYKIFCDNTRYVNIRPLPILETLIIGTYCISVLWSLFIPFGSNSMYLKLILPIIILIFSYSAAINIGQKAMYLIAVFFLFIVAVYSYFENYQKMILLTMQDGIITSTAYNILYMFPILLCCNKKWIRTSVILIVLLVIITASKRAGLLAFIIGFFLYVFSKSFIQKRNQIYRILVLLIVIFGVTLFALEYMESSDILVFSRMRDISEDGGSGRLDIYRNTLNMIVNSNPLYLLIGHGHNQVMVDSSLKLSAHNDLLEIIYDYGILVTLFYILFNIQIIKRIFCMIKEKSIYAPPLVFSYTIFIINSIISHIFIYTHYFAIFCFVWGGILGLYYKNEENGKQFNVNHS